jgi:small subunit ribosomal protein S9
MEVINTLGRRKTAVARIYLKDGSGIITVNNRDFKNYFPTPILQFKVTEPFEVTNNQGKYDVKVNLDGGSACPCNCTRPLRNQRGTPSAFEGQRPADA